MLVRLKNPNVILSTAPALVILVGVALLYNMYPIHTNSGVGFGQDPAYQYLFAGIDILQGNAPTHTDHPGTPLQTLIAGIIASSWFVLWLVGVMPLGLFDSVLRSPEVFLGTTSAVLLTITSAAIFYFGRRVYQVTQQYSIALACQFAPLLYVTVIPNMVYPTPEALLLALSITLMGVLAPVVLSSGSVRQQFSKSTANWAGIICGLGVATKLTFVPVLGLLLLFKTPQLIFRACFICILAWFIGVLPNWSRLGTMFKWFYSLLMNSGIHGAGERTVFSAQQVQAAIGWLLSQFSLFYYVVAAVGCLLILGLLLKIFQRLTTNVYKDSDPSQIEVKPAIRAISADDLLTAIAFLLACAVQTLMVAKHLGPSYMVPALPLTLLASAWLLHGQQVLRMSKTLQKVLGLCCLALVLTTATVSTTLAIRSLAQDRQKGLDSYAAIQQAIARYDQPLLIGAFNCNFAECALWFGMSLVPAMELKMALVTPSFYYYDIFNKTLRLPGKGELTHQQTAETVEQLVQQTRPVLLISPPFPHLSQLKLELVAETPVKNLYRVHGLANATKQ
jgi:hypothetical protein